MFFQLMYNVNRYSALTLKETLLPKDCLMKEALRVSTSEKRPSLRSLLPVMREFVSHFSGISNTTITLRLSCHLETSVCYTLPYLQHMAWL